MFDIVNEVELCELSILVSLCLRFSMTSDDKDVDACVSDDVTVEVTFD